VNLSLPAFLGVSALVIITPGPDTALTVRNTLGGGRRGGLATALGVVTGQLTWAVAVGAGLAGLVMSSRTAFRALRLAGAAYLVYLGVHSLLRLRRAVPGKRQSGGGPPAGRLGTAAAYRQGLVSNLCNPKAGLFFIGLLPQFLPPDGAFAWRLAPLGMLMATMTLMWLAGYAVAVDKSSAILRSRRGYRMVETLTGLVLVALGMLAAVEGL
jgi:threonine/homoserine/homoserine lactone efflux protein